MSELNKQGSEHPVARISSTGPNPLGTKGFDQRMLLGFIP